MDSPAPTDASPLLAPNTNVRIYPLYRPRIPPSPEDGDTSPPPECEGDDFPTVLASPSLDPSHHIHVVPLSDTHIEYPGGHSLFEQPEETDIGDSDTSDVSSYEMYLHIPSSDAARLSQRGVLVLAGDIGSPHLRPELRRQHQQAEEGEGGETAPTLPPCGSLRDMFGWASQHYAHVCYVAGNHEFCNGVVEDGRRLMQEACDEFPNVHFLDCGEFRFEHVTFVGCTLWSPVPEYAVGHIGHTVDGLIEYRHRNGAYFDSETHLQVHHTNAYHERELEYLRERLTALRAEKKKNEEDSPRSGQQPPMRVVVATHHSPLPCGVCPPVHEHPRNDRWWAFVSDLRGFLAEFADVIDVWVFGHTHWTCGWRVVVGGGAGAGGKEGGENEVLVVSNQVGYFARPGKGDFAGFRRGLSFAL